MHVHLIGVCGTGMGALAALLVEAGHTVSGSDTRFDPPVGPLLARLGVETMQGWDPAHLERRPDLVVVGNVCRPDNPEARAAVDGPFETSSLPETLESLFLSERSPVVVAGTHGKTTTTALTHHLFQSAGMSAGLFVGGVPIHTGKSAEAGAPGAPFVVEGDEYDSAFFDKTPKFWKYRPKLAALTSIEHDHIDIYPERGPYIDAFRRFVGLIPEDGLLVAWAGDPVVREVARAATCKVALYALEADDCGDQAPVWLAAPAPNGVFDLFVGGSYGGRFASPLIGRHNLRNALAAIALCAEGFGVALDGAARSLASFRGVERRQQLLAEVNGVLVFDDFAHHPTAVRATLDGFRERFSSKRIIAVFEPRSATASRRLHQEAYPGAFARADAVIVAPVGRSEIPEEERLDTKAIAAALEASGKDARTAASHDEVVAMAVELAADSDVIVCMSNGVFGDVPQRIAEGLAGGRRA